MELFLDFLMRWGHILFGITWIGLLYYFNFVQTEYFKEAEEMARKDAVAKLNQIHKSQQQLISKKKETEEQ